MGEPDASGRRRPVPVKDSNFRIPADVVVHCHRPKPQPAHPQDHARPASRPSTAVVMVDEQTMKTSKKGVFAGGDVATGGATVILAMGQGKIAAKAIDEYLRTGEW